MPKKFKEAFRDSREKIWNKKRARLKLHRSFRRSYREDYTRSLRAPSLLVHAFSTLKILSKNWRLFAALLGLIVVSNIVLVGLMSEETYTSFQSSLDQNYAALTNGELGRVAKSALLLISTVTTGGLTKGPSEVQQLFAILLFAVTWLVTIYLLRQLLAGNRPRLRDGLFNALAPLLSLLAVVAVVFIHLLPIFIFVILYSTAVATEFLTQPLYAFVFWLFSVLLILLSAYLLPTSVLALVSVTVPGIYPMTALNATTDLVQGRRTKLIIRVLFCVVFLAVIWTLVLLPLIWLDLVLKASFPVLAELDIPFTSFCLQIMTTFSAIYFTAYIYLFYRRMLDDPS